MRRLESILEQQGRFRRRGINMSDEMWGRMTKLAKERNNKLKGGEWKWTAAAVLREAIEEYLSKEKA